ncbi:hypothetical protein N7491_003376 [Penicillium cf. griseofulvum]|uniref:Uncharacterized protein n=1 Tax=Penicillium cf. griseofulvum TaxID=2972120 RepID=A0A9W9MRF9_9EURO|nr:hypothetical protein N7472_002450 [Penicillium cf. griseofulvum]KAJ5440970.1 hypothetical protein N7491_003376 [Penicillium cf. griseofulvum]KAJ5449015.1 hypothetical protein N7445_003836 [Penicillium cf. griseofulvum]
MPVHAVFDDGYSSEDSEYSETDVSLHRPGVRTHIRQRSLSRHRRPEVTQFLAPTQTRVYRSASTSGRRRERAPSAAPAAPVPPAVMIFNEQGLQSESRAENKPQSRRVHQKFKENHNHGHRHSRYDDEDDVPPPPPRRGRAVSSVSREHSPFYRDQELAMGQHMLERNDVRQDLGQQILERDNFRQDLDLWKHQQEIERLQRQLQKTRDRSAHEREQIIINPPADPRESRMIRDEADLYEEELSERLRKLQRLERKQQSAEEERKAEERYQLKKYATDKRTAAEQEEIQRKLQEEKLRDLARKQDEKGQREKLMREERWKELARQKEEEEEREKLVREEKWKELARRKEEEEAHEKLVQQIRDEDMRKAREAEEARKKELAMKAAAVEEWKLQQERLKQLQAEEAARKAKEFHDRLRSIGYSEEEVDAIVNKKKKDAEKKEEKEKEEKKKQEEEKKKKEEEKKKEEKKEETKLTWIKVHRKHLLPDTLMAYGLPWDWDETDTNYIIIKKWIDHDFQDQLFAHTQRLREGKVIAETSHSRTELKVNDRRKDRLFLVRKKSPSGRVRILT